MLKKKFVLFDLDGTLIDSSGPIKFLWDKWALNQGLDPAVVYQYSVGRLAIDTMKYFMGDSETLINMSRLFVNEELLLANDVVGIPGAIEFANAIPVNQWAIVTSCSYELACARMSAVNLPRPNVLVTAETVPRGKPNPDCYIKAADLLNARAEDCVVFEDSDAGIMSANLAKMDVISINNASDLSILNISDFNDISIRINDLRELILEDRNDR